LGDVLLFERLGRFFPDDHFGGFGFERGVDGGG
jgi:hypothetical protein